MPPFKTSCRQCPRLASFLDTVKAENPDYFAKPVPPYGPADAQLMIVGLAPGMHGANRTGRPFTGDYAGVLLYQTLFDFGFANKPESIALGDGFELINCRITNAVKCLPPQNKPIGSEINQCNTYLTDEIASMPAGSVVVALGSIAHNAVLKALGQKQGFAKFAHNVAHRLPNGMTLIDSYHCSRYNTQTKRLTEKMFRDVFHHAKQILG
ncbi:MAG: uracil-DNA glycosylase [Gammaproteobacteria bacterium]|nr:uracil-DNA glycosylase [Gammaproteobacteria bacterium]